MYERVPVDNSANHQQTAVPAELTLDDGRVLKGKFHISGSRGIVDVLNGAGQFLDFEQYAGERELISKSSIRAIKLTNVPRARNLTAYVRAQDSFDPHKILGVAHNASFDEVRAAYHRLTKVYHPDKYASTDLPKEVLDYLNTISRRLNTAFAALKQPDGNTKRTTTPSAAATQTAKPIYTSKPSSA